jgi:hypothetical protein
MRFLLTAKRRISGLKVCALNFILILTTLFLPHCKEPSSPKPPKMYERLKNYRLNIALATFKEFGFELYPYADTSHLSIPRGPNDLYDNDIYRYLYFELSDEPGFGHNDFRPICNKVWGLNLEMINQTGDYVRIMENLSRITGDEIQFQNLKDSVPESGHNGDAWISFDFKGKSYKWDLKVNDDWVDLVLLTKIQKLIDEYNTRGDFTYYYYGDYIAISYFNADEFNRFRIKTGLQLEWMKDKNFNQ